MRRWLTLVVLLCVTAGCAGDAGPQGDVVLRRSMRLGNAPDAEAGLVYWGARTRVSDDARGRLIVDLDTKTVTLVDKQARTYIVRTLDEVVRTYDGRGKPSTGAVVLTRTDKTEQIAGYEARQYTFATHVVRGGVWISDELRPAPVWREWEGLIAYLEGGFAGGVGITEAVAALKGYPLRTTLTFADGEGAWTLTTQVVEVVPGASAAEITAVPAGFQRASNVRIRG